MSFSIFFGKRGYLGLFDTGRDIDISPTELILGAEEWILSTEIIDTMDWYFREFDDSIPNPPRMNSQIWFHRHTKTPCTVCGKIYKPHRDRQRFCHQCASWFHLGCLGGDKSDEVDFESMNNQGELEEKKLGADGFPAVFGDVLRGPTTRGHGGSYNFDNNWLNTGSGVQKDLITKWRDEGVCPGDWLAKLGENFLRDFLIGKSWTVYTCPTCGDEV